MKSRIVCRNSPFDVNGPSTHRLLDRVISPPTMAHSLQLAIPIVEGYKIIPEPSRQDLQ